MIPSRLTIPIGFLLLLVSCGTAPEPPAVIDPEQRAKSDPRYASTKQQFLGVYQSGRYAEGLQLAIPALEIYPEVAEPYVWVSTLFSKLGQETEGARFFAKFAGRHPTLPRPRFYEGRHHLRSNHPQDALIAFRQAAELDPGDAEYSYWQGVILQGMGEFDEALAAYRHSYDADPATARKASVLVEVLRVSGHYEEAERIVREALVWSPEHAQLHFALGQLRLRDKDYGEAESALRHAVKFAPTHLRAHQDLARILKLTGRPEEAASLEMIATRLNDYEKGKKNIEGHLSKMRDPAIPMLLAELELTERNYDDAARWLTRSVSLGGTNVRTYAGLAEALYRGGDVAGGDAALARIEGESSGRIDLARAARAVATGDRDQAEEWISTALAKGPDEREFLRRAADLYAEIGLVSESAVLLVRATSAPRSSSVTLR